MEDDNSVGIMPFDPDLNKLNPSEDEEREIEKQSKSEKQEKDVIEKLVESDGWKKFREKINVDISNLEKFNEVDYTKNDALIGQQVKVDKKVAEKLRLYFEDIDLWAENL